ncbi:hypothetical protein K402DRAFT_256464 [Aulographum hederae CBS 113979]|uniref:Uncharacterized protein n=1 Tax=Aulographum hederae CBS 113979 TaxID=1176131 RepID=A0A6G1H907_9PEZI|nr:hypothetical protein K402DRAFT_256464 [Aulographum hederae CBS 113979]
MPSKMETKLDLDSGAAQEQIWNALPGTWRVHRHVHWPTSHFSQSSGPSGISSKIGICTITPRYSTGFLDELVFTADVGLYPGQGDHRMMNHFVIRRTVDMENPRLGTPGLYEKTLSLWFPEERDNRQSPINWAMDLKAEIQPGGSSGEGKAPYGFWKSGLSFRPEGFQTREMAGTDSFLGYTFKFFFGERPHWEMEITWILPPDDPLALQFGQTWTQKDSFWPAVLPSRPSWMKQLDTERQTAISRENLSNEEFEENLGVQLEAYIATCPPSGTKYDIPMVGPAVQSRIEMLRDRAANRDDPVVQSYEEASALRYRKAISADPADWLPQILRKLYLEARKEEQGQARTAQSGEANDGDRSTIEDTKGKRRA